MTFNELVKIMTLTTSGPGWFQNISSKKYTCNEDIYLLTGLDTLARFSAIF